MTRPLPAAPDEGYYTERILPFNEGPKGRAEMDLVLRRLAGAGVRGRVLDLGCGPARNSERLRAAGFATVGADLSPAGLELARRLGFEKLVRLDAARLAFRDGSFAGALLAHVLGHVQDPARVLAEVRRCLGPGGCAIVTTPNERFVEVYRAFNERGLMPYQRDPTVRRYYDAALLERELSEAGFASVQVEAFGAPPRIPPELLAAGLLSPDVHLADPLRRERLLSIARGS